MGNNDGMMTYLSFGGGVNSVALMLLLLDEGREFEAVFVDHESDWPETYEYLEMFQEWLRRQGVKPVTVIKSEMKEAGKTWNSLLKYCQFHDMVPLRQFRWCTSKFKVKPLQRYFKKPCWTLLGFAADEAKRAKLSPRAGEEFDFPLIEHGITRQGCIDIIEAHDLPVPDKSGCFFCPFQRLGEFRKLRRLHPDLYCTAKTLEDRNMQRRIEAGKKPIYLQGRKPLDVIVNEKQGVLWPEDKPPCYCGR